MSTESSDVASLQPVATYKTHAITNGCVRMAFCSAAGTIAVIPGVLTLFEQSSLQRMSLSSFVPLLISRLYCQRVASAFVPTAIVSTQKSAVISVTPEVSKKLNTFVSESNDEPLSVSTKIWTSVAISGGLAIGDRGITTPKNNCRTRAALGLDTKLTKAYVGYNTTYAQLKFSYLNFLNLLTRSGFKYGVILAAQPLIDEWIREYISYSQISVPASIMVSTGIKVGATLPFEMAQVKRTEYCHQHKTVFNVPSSGHFMLAIWRQQGLVGLMQGWRGNSISTAVLYGSIVFSEAAVRKAERWMTSSSFFQKTPVVVKDVESPLSAAVETVPSVPPTLSGG